MELTIGSINARGLGDRSKRREFFNWLRKKQMAMYFIQEAHCTENNMHDWRAEWGYQALFSCCSSKKAGVIILFNNTFTFQISRTYCDPGGRYIICDLITNGKQLTLANIYAPNNDDPTFFTSVFERLADFKCDEVIIGGDYNLVLDVEKDKKGGLAKTHKKSLEVINSFCEDFDLIDVWRIKTLNNDDLHRAKRTPKYNVDLTFLVITFS